MFIVMLNDGPTARLNTKLLSLSSTDSGPSRVLPLTAQSGVNLTFVIFPLRKSQGNEETRPITSDIKRYRPARGFKSVWLVPHRDRLRYIKKMPCTPMDTAMHQQLFIQCYLLLVLEVRLSGHILRQLLTFQLDCLKTRKGLWSGYGFKSLCLPNNKLVC
jgi:hypothetical protein